MELVIIISILIAVISVFVSCLAIRRVKRQISEMTDALADIKNGSLLEKWRFINARLMQGSGKVNARLA